MTSNLFINELFTSSIQQNADFEAKVFIEVASKVIGEAETELAFGTETKKAIAVNKNKNLAQIVIWHLQKGIEKYQIAISHLKQAKLFAPSAQYLKSIDAKLKKCVGKIEKIFTVKGQTEKLLNR